MPKTAKVTLGGREYVLTEKVMGVSAAWRLKLRQSNVLRIFESLDEALAQMVKSFNELSSEGQMNLSAGLSLATAAPAIVRGLVNSIDEVVDLLYDYAPELGADSEWLAENAYNEEAIAAFIEVLKLNFPFTELWGLIRGSRAQATATNLPSRNGDAGTKKSTARSRSR